MSDFGKDIVAQVNEFRQAVQEDSPTVAKKKTGKSVTKYQYEASGIDMIVSRIVNDKCTMKLFICLSQPDSTGNGTLILKSMRDGTMKEATVDSINSFFNGLVGVQKTGSNVIPTVASGKDFAKRLYAAKDAHLIEVFKEGLFNTDLLDSDEYSLPWYVCDQSMRYHSSAGYGIEDRHPKLMRLMIETLAKNHNITYSDALAKSCDDRYSRRYDGNDGPFKSIWAFSMLADMFDEPYATRCFLEYINNARLSGLTAGGIRSFFERLTEPGAGYRYGASRNWAETVKSHKCGNVLTTLDKNRLWQFIQHAVGVGLGSKLNSYLDLYADYLVQCQACDLKIKDKYPDNLQVMHDIYSEKYTLIKEFRETATFERMGNVGRQYIDMVHDGYQLKTLTAVNEFLEEARQNCNCVASYVENVKQGKCWIASFRKKDADTTQLTIEIRSNGEMVQIKGRYNREPTDEERELLRPFQEAVSKKMSVVDWTTVEL